MIEIRHLKKSYDLSTPLIDVNADIRDGDVIAVIGPSGTGKSTLLRCINLLEKATSGSIRIDGEEILSAACDESRIRRKVGMIFQSFYLFSHLTAIENIMRPQTDLLGKSRQEAYERGLELLGKVGLADRMLKYPDELSGGQKQRVAIARALAMDPEIILFDEPTSALDPAMRGEVQAVIRDLAVNGRTMMIVTHDMHFARMIANRVFFMNNGVIYEEGTPDEIFLHPKKELTRQFIRDLRVLEIEIKGDSLDFPGAVSTISDYCSRNRISPRTSLRIQQVFEELVRQTLPAVPGVSRIRFTAEYSETYDAAAVTVQHDGDVFDPETAEPDLSLAIVKNAVTSMECRTVPDETLNRQIFLQLRND